MARETERRKTPACEERAREEPRDDVEEAKRRQRIGRGGSGGPRDRAVVYERGAERRRRRDGDRSWPPDLARMAARVRGYGPPLHRADDRLSAHQPQPAEEREHGNSLGPSDPPRVLLRHARCLRAHAGHRRQGGTDAALPREEHRRDRTPGDRPVVEERRDGVDCRLDVVGKPRRAGQGRARPATSAV